MGERGRERVAMFERFTARARRAIVLAQEEARLLGHDFIGTEHVLLGLLHEGEGVAGVVLKEMGFTLDGMRDEVRLLIGPTVDDPDKGKLPFTPRSKKVLELSLREALSLKHNYIGTEHLLLAILREGEGVGAQILVKHGGTIGGVRARVIERLEGYGKAGIPAIPPMPSPRRAGHTPAVDAIIPKAEELAMGDPTGSHHLLLSIIDEPDSLAARALTSFGITREAVTERLEAIGTEGTTDHVPEPDPFTVHAFEGGLTIRIDDEELAEKVRSGELTVSFKPTT